MWLWCAMSLQGHRGDAFAIVGDAATGDGFPALGVDVPLMEERLATFCCAIRIFLRSALRRDLVLSMTAIVLVSRMPMQRFHSRLMTVCLSSVSMPLMTSSAGFSFLALGLRINGSSSFSSTASKSMMAVL